MAERGNFGSRLGIILATAGSAVGLGNVWRFPFMTGHNGGAAFILLYLACVVLLGIPGMICEFIVGRRAQTNAPRAYSLFGRRWRWVGYLGVLTSTVILGFYAVVAGWCLWYLFVSLSAQLGSDAQQVAASFQQFSGDAVKPCLCSAAFLLITHVVVVQGIHSGIERASKLLMPILLLLLVVIVVASCMLPGAMKGVSFLFKPDFTKLSSSVFLEALGQAFFSLSLGTACLCTYASYFSHETNLSRSAIQIALLDSAIAILAGLMIFPAAFSVGVQPDSGPSLLFITLPNVFRDAFAGMPLMGYAISIMFYLLLVFAALTSTISMHEIGTAFFTEELHQPRKRAAWLLTSVCLCLAVACSLSVGNRPALSFFGLPLMELFDRATAQLMLPAGALFTSIMIGWFADRQLVRSEFTNHGAQRGSLFRAWLFSVKYVVPVFILLILLHQLGVV